MIRFKTITFAAALVLSSMSNTLAGVISSSTDEIFVTNAAQAGLAEIVDGRLAKASGSNSAIRTIGERMVKDHTQANTMLVSIARADELIVPTQPNAHDRARIAKEKTLSGTAFDMAYLKSQIAAHQETLDLFNVEVAQGSNPQLVAFAKHTIPTIQKHLKMFEDALKSESSNNEG